MNATEMNRMSENMNRTISKFGDLLERYLRNRGVDQPAYGILIALYTVIIVVGAMGNALVVSTNNMFVTLSRLNRSMNFDETCGKI